MLRRNLLKSLAAIIPFSFMSKNIVAKDNEESWEHITKDKNGNIIKIECSDGFWKINTYDENNNRLSEANSNGFWQQSTYDQNNKLLTSKDSFGHWVEYTRNSQGQPLTYKDSHGYGSTTFNEYGNVVYGTYRPLERTNNAK
jgi:YD repeat-containing protein